jgi:large-conductance mechanosensitive channel
MLDKLKANKGHIIGHAVAAIIGLVFTGMLASFIGDRIGLASLGLYLYALLGHNKVKKQFRIKAD